MNKAFLETLYETSISFKIFVDRNCQTYGWTNTGSGFSRRECNGC